VKQSNKGVFWMSTDMNRAIAEIKAREILDSGGNPTVEVECCLEVGELLNAIGIAIQMRASAADLASFQFGSQPLLTASIHPIVGAAVNALATHFQSARPGKGRKEG
jgi:hypothetical protein